MAILFLNNINLSDNQLLNAKLQVTSTAPTAAVGQIYFDSTAADETAKYYSNTTDTWVSLKEYSFPAVIPANGYVTSTVAGTVPKPIITFDLNAVNGAAAAGERYLTKTNLWAEVSTIPGTYTWTLAGDAGGPTSIPSATAVTIVGGDDLETTLVGTDLTVDLKVGPGIVGTSDNYVSNQGIAVADADDSIPFNSYTPGVNPPSTQVNVVKKTTLGTIPVNALTLVKQYIDDSVAGGLVYQGGYNAATNTPDLTTSPNSILKGWTYTVTTAGTFLTEAVEVGDVLIAEVDDPSSLGNWTTVQNNIDLATLATVGIGNVNIDGAGNKDGLSLAYAAGTATVGLDIESLPNLSVAITAADLASLEIPLYNGDTSDANEKIEVATLLSAASSQISFATTITDTATITHSLATKDVIIQLYDVTTDETVYADVERASVNTSTITFASTPTNSVRVLVQKIG